jgi:hypothetical protein
MNGVYTQRINRLTVLGQANGDTACHGLHLSRGGKRRRSAAILPIHFSRTLDRHKP